MRQTHATMFAIAITSAAVVALGATRSVRAFSDDGNDNRLQAIPEVFVGAADDCFPGSPAGSRIVTSAWLGGMGLPDNGGSNTTLLDLATNPNKNDPHQGLLLSKNGPTADCSAAGATIKGVRGLRVTDTFELGFDYRNGGHCGAGAPRYNVVTKSSDGSNTFHFVGGCSNGVRTPAPQDPLEWTRVRFNNAAAIPPLAADSRIVSIELIFDEGTDTALTDDVNGVGLAVVDNLDINGALIDSGNGVADGTNNRGGGNDGKDGTDR
jgi:hypothetical protein